MEIRDKLTITIGKERGEYWGKEEEGQGACIKDPWAKTLVGRIECGIWGCLGQLRVIGEKWAQL